MAGLINSAGSRLVVVAGSSQCGKTTNTVKEVLKFKTAFVWDIQAQWSDQKGFTRVNSLAELKAIVKAGKKGRFCYVSNGNLKAEFEHFCMLAYHYGRYYGVCAVVAEELADVTSTAKAGEHWGILCRRSLKYGVTIFAISQRWAEADKTAMGNATDFYIFRLARKADVKYMSENTMVDASLLYPLKPYEFIHYDALKQVATHGRTKQILIKRGN